MSEIKLRADEAREMARHIGTEANAAKDQMESLRTYLNNLADSFTGQTATAFDNTFNSWKNNADSMLDSLGELGDFLRKAADVIEQTDTEIASQLPG